MAVRTELEIDRAELAYLASFNGPFLITAVASQSRKDRFLANGWIELTSETYKGFPVYVVSSAGTAFIGGGDA